MDKTQFAENELQELEALEIRGGSVGSSQPQTGCSNNARGCGGGDVAQTGCSNNVVGCGEKVEKPLTPQDCPSITLNGQC